MSKLTYECSLNDTTILRNLILENPELPALIFCGEGVWNGEYSYNQADVSKCEIEELTLYEDMWLDKGDYADRLFDELSDIDEYKNYQMKSTKK